MKSQLNTLSAILLLLMFVTNSFGQHFIQADKMDANLRNENTRFGKAVDNTSGFAIIGADFEYLNIDGKDSLHLAGAAYILKEDGSGNWNQEKMLTPKTRFELERFGSAVCINERFAIVGAPYKKTFKTTGGGFVGRGSSLYLRKK